MYRLSEAYLTKDCARLQLCIFRNIRCIHVCRLYWTAHHSDLTMATKHIPEDPCDWPIAEHEFDGSKPFSIDAAANKIDKLYDSKKDYKQKLGSIVKRIDQLLEIMYAQDRYGLLLVFQAMDAAGKDGTIKRLLTGVNPATVQVYSFKQPSEEELDHGYLWRVIKRMPERGRLGVFNRSYYEEVLIVRVHPEILTDYQRIPLEFTENLEEVFKNRFDEIRNFERYATKNGIKVVKFFLNVSEEEQRQRLLARLDNPDKHWKFSASDVEEREHWPAYMTAFEDCINATATPHAPWYTIPADDKLNMRLLVAATTLVELEALDIDWPPASKKLAENMKSIRYRLSK